MLKKTVGFRGDQPGQLSLETRWQLQHQHKDNLLPSAKHGIIILMWRSEAAAPYTMP